MHDDLPDEYRMCGGWQCAHTPHASDTGRNIAETLSDGLTNLVKSYHVIHMHACNSTGAYREINRVPYFVLME